MSDGIGVGWGARPYADGTDAVYFVAQENYPVEFLEIGYPVRLRTLRHPEGFVRRRAAIAAAAASCASTTCWPRRPCWRVRIDSVKNPPWGIAGGMAGGTGRVVVNPGTNHERAAGAAERRQRRSGRATCCASRPAAAAATAIRSTGRPRRCWRTCWAASSAPTPRTRLYGVAIADGAVDLAATAKLRAKRPAAGAFHRHALCRQPCLRTSLAIAVDIGGTFTDIALHDATSGRIWRAKTPSVPERSLAGLPDRHPPRAGRGRPRRAQPATRAARHDRRHQHDPRGQGRQGRPGDDRWASAMCWRSAARTSRAAPTISPG